MANIQSAIAALIVLCLLSCTFGASIPLPSSDDNQVVYRRQNHPRIDPSIKQLEPVRPNKSRGYLKIPGNVYLIPTGDLFDEIPDDRKETLVPVLLTLAPHNRLHQVAVVTRDFGSQRSIPLTQTLKRELLDTSVDVAGVRVLRLMLDGRSFPTPFGRVSDEVAKKVENELVTGGAGSLVETGRYVMLNPEFQLPELPDGVTATSVAVTLSHKPTLFDQGTPLVPLAQLVKSPEQPCNSVKANKYKRPDGKGYHDDDTYFLHRFTWFGSYTEIKEGPTIQRPMINNWMKIFGPTATSPLPNLLVAQTPMAPQTGVASGSNLASSPVPQPESPISSKRRASGSPGPVPSPKRQRPGSDDYPNTTSPPAGEDSEGCPSGVTENPEEMPPTTPSRFFSVVMRPDTSDPKA